MNMRQARPWAHEALFALCVFIAGLGVSVLRDIAKDTIQIKESLSTIAERVLQHERRIEALEIRTR